MLIKSIRHIFVANNGRCVLLICHCRE